MDLVLEIKKKKELRGLSNEYVQSIIDSVIKKHCLSYTSPKEEKEIVRLVRAELRLKTGRFTLSDSETLSDELSEDDLLRKHSSTRERLEFYPKLKATVESLSHKTILDLGCGINPLVFGKMAERYEAYDIDESALKIVSHYLKKQHVKSQVHASDITKVERFPHVDLTFLLKILDVIETRGHKKAEHLLSKLNSKSIIISFSTRTLSGAPMNHPQRGWIERLLTRLGYTFTILKSTNEIFYICSK